MENCAGRAAEKQQKLKPLSEIQDGHMKGAGLNLAANGPAPRRVLLGLLWLSCPASSRAVTVLRMLCFFAIVLAARSCDCCLGESLTVAYSG